MSEKMNGELAPTPDLGSMVSKLLANPELISQIATAVGAEPSNAAPPPPEREARSPSGERAAQTPPADGALPVGQIMSLLGSVGGGGDAARRTALLSALKPYCNEHRCRTIDYMIGISKIAGGFSGFGK